MQLISLLDPKMIYFEEDNLSKEENLKNLVARICKHYKLPNCGENLFRLVMQREAESSTVYPTGLAIPHIRVDNFNDTLIGVCIPRRPIMDNGQEIKCIVLIITDKAVAKLYLNIVAAFMRISKDEALLASLLAQKDGNGVYQLLKHANISVKEDLTVRDIMTPEPVIIQETATIRELADLLGKYNIKTLPVVNQQNIFVGEVNIVQYLKVGVPDYLMLMDNLLFLRSYEPFESLYEKDEEVLVRDIMTMPEHTLTPDTSIIEAVFKMIQTGKRFFTVVQDKHVAGAITAMDIFRKVVRS
jgi:CBS domain-containing protein